MKLVRAFFAKIRALFFKFRKRAGRPLPLTHLVTRLTYLTFNVIRVLKKNVLTFCLQKFLIKNVLFPLGNHLNGSIHTLQYSRRNIMDKSVHLASFSKQVFSIYFEHNRNPVER